MMEEISREQAKVLTQKIFGSLGQSCRVDQRTYEDMVTKTANGTHGDELYYDCPKCLNRGYTYRYRDGLMYMVPCDCMKVRETNRRLSETGIAQTIEENTFENFTTDDPWQNTLKLRCIEFAEQFKPGMSIGLLGQSGAGKTHLCTAICGKIVRMGYSLKYVLWRDVVAKLQANVYNDDVYTRVTEGLKNVEVLYIDDMFKLITPNPTQRVRELEVAFKVINDRTMLGKSTLISSEMLIDEIKSLDEAIAGRIVKMTSKRYLIQISKSESKNYRFKDLETV